jgi:malonate-semialdehyde dehydrogenase (acetylating)/methylmalonate-semialdehyde dehydrogenase
MSVIENTIKPQHIIGGELQAGSGTEALDVFDPATGQKISEVVAATTADVDAAVGAAKAAFPAWSALSLQRRVQFLYKMRQLLLDNTEDLARTIVLDQGKTLDEARGEVQRAYEFLETAIAAPMLYHARSANVTGTLDARHVREPLGVCAAITPFNFPVMNPTQFSGWALVTGNTLVLKASEQDPLASTAVIALLQQSGIPAGVLNLIHGQAGAAQHLIEHPDVAAVSCITSSPTARAIYELASAADKRVQANGGAKNPIVVAEDADLDLAAAGIVSSAFGMAGQRCLAGSRVITVGGIHDALVEKVAAEADRMVVGGGFGEGVTLGPVVSAGSKARVEAALARAAEAGATLVRDGRGVVPQGGGATEDGYFVGPSIITGLDAADAVAREEVFGPALSVHQAGSLEEGTALANDTEFGNAATLYTTSGSAARAFESSCRAGNIGINAFPAPPANFTMGGAGTSFYGDIHICGDGPLRFYTEEKLVVSRW